MNGSRAVRSTCCAAFSSTGTPRVHILMGAAFSATSPAEAKRWPRNSYDVLFSGDAMIGTSTFCNGPQSERAVTTRIGETPALSAELRVHGSGPGGSRTRDLVIDDDVVPPAFVTAFKAPGDKILRDVAELRDWASRGVSNPRPPAQASAGALSQCSPRTHSPGFCSIMRCGHSRTGRGDE